MAWKYFSMIFSGSIAKNRIKEIQKQITATDHIHFLILLNF